MDCLKLGIINNKNKIPPMERCPSFLFKKLVTENRVKNELLIRIIEKFLYSLLNPPNGDETKNLATPNAFHFLK